MNEILKRLAKTSAGEETKLVDCEVHSYMSQQAEQLAQKLRGTALDFEQLLYCGPQFCERPVPSFEREVISAVANAQLRESQSVSEDAGRRAKELAESIRRSDFTGIEVRAAKLSVKEFIEKREGCEVDLGQIFLVEGRREALDVLLSVLIQGCEDGVMVPVPQYPLYSTFVELRKGAAVPYYLNENKGWAFDIKSLRFNYRRAKKRNLNIRAIIVSNPNTLTGQAMSPNDLQEILSFCHKNKILLIADEPIHPSNPLNKIMKSMGRGYERQELVVIRSVDGGEYRGGCMILENIDAEEFARVLRIKGIALSASVVAQTVLELAVNPPRAGLSSDGVVEKYNKEKEAISIEAKERLKVLIEKLNSIPRVKVNESEEAMCVFPRVFLTEAAIKAAKEKKLTPDTLYCTKALKKTGLVLIPGCGFGQMRGSYHFCIANVVHADLGAALDRFKEFNEKFFDKYLPGEDESVAELEAKELRELPSLEELQDQYGEYKILKKSESEMVANETVYVVSKKWLDKWKSYVKGSPGAQNEELRDPPGAITNSDIIKHEDCYEMEDEEDVYRVGLKEHLNKGIDYEVVTQEQWNYLYSKYGGVPVKREYHKVNYYTSYVVDTSFDQIQLIILPPRDEFNVDDITTEKPMYILRSWTIKELKARIIQVLNQPRYGYELTQENFRLWKLNSDLDVDEVLQEVAHHTESIRAAKINNADPEIEDNTSLEFPGYPLDSQMPIDSLFMQKQTKKLEKIELSDSDKIIIERANEKGEFIFRFVKNLRIEACEYCRQIKPLPIACRCKMVFYCSTQCLERDVSFHENRCTAIGMDEDLSVYKKTSSSRMGIVGLQNLGNTCYMNSGLQCLSNTVLLSRYFLEDLYSEDINETNPLGTKGILAKHYAKLIKILWYDSKRVISPSFLKRVIGKFHSNFSGNAQQDGQELISTVLDALHEDLNRVKRKPYVESATTSDPEDNSISVSNWYNYLVRNQSIIVDLMHGQYKSVLKCPKCANYSVTFDPFCMIALPVSTHKQRVIKFTYVPYNLLEGMTKSTVEVEKNATVDDVREAVAKKLSVSKYGSTFTMLSGKTFDRFLCRTRSSKIFKEYSTSSLFIQEINPKFFNGPENEGIEERKKREEEVVKNSKASSKQKDLEESKTGPYLRSRLFTRNADKSEDNDDYNNGLSDDMLRVTLNVFIKQEFMFSSGYSKSRLTFDRLIYIKKSYTLRELHVAIFSYFKPLFEEYLENNAKETAENFAEDDESKASKLSDEELFAKLFSEFKEEPQTKEDGEEDLTLEPPKSKPETKFLPYELRFVNIHERSMGSSKRCSYCDEYRCDNCLVPFTSSKTVKDMLGSAQGKTAKNDYYYYRHQYHDYDKTDFELEVVFNEKLGYRKMDVRLLEKHRPSEEEKAKPKVDEVSIYSCFEKFINWEVLDKDNLWFCPICKESVQASKRMEILRCPPILILHLKRFKMKEDRFMSHMMTRRGGRLNTLIRFPLADLDLTPYVAKGEVPPVYDLYAVSNHYGDTEGGHYTAYAMNGGAWYNFDDSTVTKADAEEVCSTASYVLFYKRKDVKDEGDFKKLRQEVPESYKAPIIEEAKEGLAEDVEQLDKDDDQNSDEHQENMKNSLGKADNGSEQLDKDDESDSSL